MVPTSLRESSGSLQHRDNRPIVCVKSQRIAPESTQIFACFGLSLIQGNHPAIEEFGAAREQLYRKVEADRTDLFLLMALALADVALALKGGVPTYQVEDEEGRIHLLLHLPIEEQNEDRWCLWRPDLAGFDFSVLSHK